MIARAPEEMLMIDVTYWERRSTTDREDLAKSALAFTQAMRAAGAATSRFYWTAPDTVVVQTDVGASMSELPPSPEAAQALFGLGDLARQTRREQWIDARAGEHTYRDAGR
jgi:hypothetical protein